MPGKSSNEPFVKHVRLPLAHHAWLKVEAAKRNVTMEALLVMILYAYKRSGVKV